ncbi:MAG: hypothetical protein OWT28_07985 [Firmicutes bacterium]|nr:hypothetical protein [Bacillota bacterium]
MQALVKGTSKHFGFVSSFKEYITMAFKMRLDILTGSNKTERRSRGILASADSSRTENSSRAASAHWQNTSIVSRWHWLKLCILGNKALAFWLIARYTLARKGVNSLVEKIEIRGKI